MRDLTSFEIEQTSGGKNYNFSYLAKGLNSSLNIGVLTYVAGGSANISLMLASLRFAVACAYIGAEIADEYYGLKAPETLITITP